MERRRQLKIGFLAEAPAQCTYIQERSRHHITAIFLFHERLVCLWFHTGYEAGWVCTQVYVGGVVVDTTIFNIWITRILDPHPPEITTTIVLHTSGLQGVTGLTGA